MEQAEQFLVIATGPFQSAADDVLDLRPGDPAILVDGRTVTFAELADRVDALARAVAATTPPGARVAVLSENTLEFADAYYAIPRAGRVLVPLNYRLHPREWAGVIERTGATAIIGEAALLDALEPHLPAGARPAIVEIGPGATGRSTYDAFVAAAPTEVDLPDPDPEDTAWVLSTSGTTGAAKGAMLPHRALVAAATNTALGRPVAGDDVYLLAFALCHEIGRAHV